MRNTTWDDIDERAFARYVERRFKDGQHALPLSNVFENLQLASDGVPNLAGMLLFGKYPERHLHVCMITAVCFPGVKLSDSRYLDSENIQGTLEEQFQRGMGFIKRNLHHVQGAQGFNSVGLLEIPEEAFVELLVNALVHRDFFTNATVRLLIFADRVEIISPGALPDSLTREQILAGRSNRRNKVLAEHAAHILPYRGLGTGIPRALGAWPRIELIDEPEGNQFKAVLWRTDTGQVTGQVSEQPESQPELQPESKPESRQEPQPERHPEPQLEPESQPESQPERVLRLLESSEMGKAEISLALGQREVSGSLNKTIRQLLALRQIEMTRPDAPNSRLQKYRITDYGRALLASKNNTKPER